VTPEFKKLRDEQVEIIVDKEICYGGLKYSLGGAMADNCKQAGKLSWNACLTTLQSMGMPGFDERAVDAEWENYKQKHNPPEHPHEVGDEADWAYWGMFYGARWQNERCAALVAARDLKIEDLERTEKVYHMNRDWIAEAKEKIAALEAEVERLKKVNASLGRKFDTTTKKW
jgi:hypothetical protein